MRMDGKQVHSIATRIAHRLQALPYRLDAQSIIICMMADYLRSREFGTPEKVAMLEKMLWYSINPKMDSMRAFAKMVHEAMELGRGSNWSEKHMTDALVERGCEATMAASIAARAAAAGRQTDRASG